MGGERRDMAYPRSIRRLSALFIVMPHFVEVIFVQLSHEASKVAMLKVFRKDGFGEALILAGVSTFRLATMDWGESLTSRTTKLSPSSPHRTTCEYVGSSSIL